MNKELRWAVLGTGVIANEMAEALHQMGRRLYAVGNRTHEKAVLFGQKHQVLSLIHIYPDSHRLKPEFFLFPPAADRKNSIVILL